jgi:hypothetical protein
VAGFAPLAPALLLLGQVNLPGTQPNELTIPPSPSSTCSCHDGYDPEVIEPGQSYRATLMAFAARDPVFRAAFQVARRDRPNLTELCLRCHAPSGWLNARSEGELSALIDEDLESVTCDVCHRMVPPSPLLIGSGQYTLSPNTAKRARRGVGPTGGHAVVQSDYTGSSELCGVCHSLFNPAERAHGPAAEVLEGPYYEQRTYEEWRDSIFPTQSMECIDCHMARVSGSAARGGEVYPDLPLHSIVGSNDFAVKAVRLLNPTLPIGPEVAHVSARVEEHLHRAAELHVRSEAIETASGSPFEVSVRLTNKTGHKLPTGYPEGRRVYLEVSLHLDGRAPTTLTGAWDPETGTLVPDPQLRTYETQHGRVENGVGSRNRHLILMNQILTDTRIPPEGFMPDHADMIPAGRDYGTEAPYRHWDDVTFTFEAPEVAATTTGTITVRAMHQTMDGDVIAFLTENAAGTQEADDLQMAWDTLGHAPPKEMTRASVAITVGPRPPPVDAGVARDGGGAADAGVTPAPADGGCQAVSGSAGASAGLLAVGLLALRGRAGAGGRRRRRGAGSSSRS